MEQFAFQGYSASNMVMCYVDGEDIYRKYGNTIQGRAVCGLLGTTPYF